MMATQAQVEEVQRRKARGGMRCHLCGHLADAHQPTFPDVTCFVCPSNLCQIPPEEECRG